MGIRGTQVVLVVLAALPALGGCASMGSLGGKDGCKVYGGTRLDATLISEGWAGDSDVAKSKRIERPVLVMEGYYGLVDMPFSFIADTVMLPVTIPIAVTRHGEESQGVGQASKDEKSSAPAEPSAE